MNKHFNTNFYKEKILFLLRNDKEQLAKKLIHNIAEKKYLNSHDLNWLYDFFSPIYDDLFYDLMFKKIEITTSTKELLENLSLPLYKMDEGKKNIVIKKLK